MKETLWGKVKQDIALMAHTTKGVLGERWTLNERTDLYANPKVIV